MKKCLTTVEMIDTHPDMLTALIEALPEALFLHDETQGLFYGNRAYREWRGNHLNQSDEESACNYRVRKWQTPMTDLNETWPIHAEPTAVLTSRLPLPGSLTGVGGLARRQRHTEGEKAVHHILSQVKCLIWRAQIREQLYDDRLDSSLTRFDKEKNTYLNWDIQFIEPESVVRWLPLAYTQGSLFQEAFEAARHPDDQRSCDERAGEALRTGAAQYTQEFRIRLGNGETRWLAESVSLTRLGEGHWDAVGVCTDITALKSVEQRLGYEASHDSLTGLANRRQLIEALSLLETSPQQHSALLFLDIDDFKHLNDSLGHHFGDAVLIALAERLRALAPPDALIARLGGDEFTLLLPLAPPRPQLLELTHQLIHALNRPLNLKGNQIPLSVSIGLAQGDRYDASLLLRQADTAMHYVKEQGKSGCALFDPQMEVQAQRRYDREIALRQAIQNGEIVPHYQLVFSLETGKPVSVEALARWECSLCRPAEFIPLAESMGLIVTLGEQILRRACEDIARWRQTYPTLMVHVNISEKQFHQSNFAERVEKILRETHLIPGALVLEITESILLTDTDSCLEKLQALADLGVQLCLDDFGTSYSSLAYLSRFPVRGLKIDKSFVHALNSLDPIVARQNEAIVRTIIALGKTLSLSITAEGVETEAQFEKLIQLGVDQAQGYLFGHPFSATGIEDDLSSRYHPALRRAA
jgi:diguanylate cyclase (GGDEF)-like protein